MIDKDFIYNLTPIEIQLLSTYISKLALDKINNSTSNADNLDKNVCSCPKCKSSRYIKYGFNKGHRQKYKCKDCGFIFLSTTNTIFSRSKLTYNDWMNFIACEINGSTLSQEAVSISKSVTTCFYMRHKLYRAIKDIVESQILSEEIKFDCTYHKINLKGTKSNKMPRLSKKRGKSDKHNSIKGISKHKVCIFTCIDSHDNIYASIAGNGSETFEMLKPYKTLFKRNATFICDSKPSNILLVKEAKGKSSLIPSKKHLNKDGNHINDINQIHSELKSLNRKYKGISTRHLPDYLNWYCFLKKLIYSIELKKRKIEGYIRIMNSNKELINKYICKIKMPIDLYSAYGEYNYGIYHKDTTV